MIKPIIGAYVYFVTVVNAPNGISWDPNINNLPNCPDLGGVDLEWDLKLREDHPNLVKPYEKFTPLKTEFWPPKLIQKRQSFYKDLDYLAEHVDDVFYEKLLLNFIRNHATVIESHLRMSWIYPSDIAVKIESIFLDLKKTYQNKSFRLSMEGEGPYQRIIPRVDIVPRENAFGTALSDQSACYRETRSIENKQEADHLVQVLSQIDELSSRYKFRECDSRANFMYQLLLYMGVPRKDLQKVMIFPDDSEKNNLLSWTSEDQIPEKVRKWIYHVGIICVTKNKEEFVIDPSSDPNQALSLSEWRFKSGAGTRQHDIERYDTSFRFYQDSYYGLYAPRFLADLPYHSKLRNLINRLLA